MHAVSSFPPNNGQLQFTAKDVDPFFQDPETGNTAFHLAAALADGKRLAELARAPIPYNHLEIRNSQDQTALHIAASCGNVEGCKILLELGAFRDARSGPQAKRPLHMAAEGGHTEVIKLYEGTNIDCKTNDENTPFWLACERGKEEAARTLLGFGADPWTRTGKWTALHVAAYEGHASIIRLCAKWKESIDKHETDSATALYLACQQGHLEAARELIALGANLDFVHFEEKMTPLDIACFNGLATIARLLLDAGASPHVVCEKNKYTPLMYAAFSGCADTIRCFKPIPGVVDARDRFERTAFAISCEEGHLEAATELLAMGSKIDIVDTAGETVLFGIADAGHVHILPLFNPTALLGRNVRRDFLDLRNNQGESALHMAATMNHTGVVRTLLRYGASIRVLPNCVLPYSREMIDVFLEHQRKKLDACCKKIAQEACFEEVIDALIDQLFLNVYFSKILTQDPLQVSRLVKIAPDIDRAVFCRLYKRLPVYSKRDLSLLYNEPQCKILLDFIKKTQEERLEAIAKKYSTIAEIKEIKELGEILVSLEMQNPVALFCSSVKLKKRLCAPCQELDALHSLNTLIFQKYCNATFSQIFVTDEPMPNIAVPSYPLSDTQFDEANTFDLITKRYGLKKTEIQYEEMVATGLLTGRDLQLIGVDNGFYQADHDCLRASLAARKKALMAWSKKCPAHEERINWVLYCFEVLEKRLFAKDPVEAITLSFGNLSLTPTPLSNEMDLCKLDQESALILIDLFIQTKEADICDLLHKANASSLSEYVDKTEDRSFI